MDVPGDPALSGRRSPTGLPRATTNEEGQAAQMLPTATTIPKPRVPSDYCASYKLGYSWTGLLPHFLKHVSKDTLK